MQPPETLTGATTQAYPPKYSPAGEAASQDYLRPFISLLIYVAAGYFLLKRWDLLLVISGILIIHEAGHFAAMKFFGYEDVGIFFIPFFGAFVKGSKREVSQRQSSIVLLAGPLPGIALGCLLWLLHFYYPDFTIGKVSLFTISLLFIWINLINLLPVFPLDGGQLLNRLYLDEEGLFSNIFLTASSIAIAIAAVYFKFYILLILPATFLFRLLSARRYGAMEKMMADAGFDLDKNFEDLSDAQYWQMRDRLITGEPQYKNLRPGPPYNYDNNEAGIASVIEGTLQRNLLQDAGLGFKTLIAILWLGAILLPWYMHLPFFFRHIF